MRLTTQDKIEFLKAAVKADDLEGLKRWLVSVVDASDVPPADGKGDTPVAVPPFRPRPAELLGDYGPVPPPDLTAPLAVAMDGLSLEVVTPGGEVVFGGIADPGGLAKAVNARFAGDAG